MAGWLRTAGLAVVLTAAAVLSFAALRDLAIAVRIDERLAFLLPIAVDAGAAVSCTVWLSPTVRPDARRFACWLTWSLLGATVVGNASQLGMHANGIVPPWWVAVAVGAVPPAVVGGVVHLLVLVARADGAEPWEAEAPAPVVELPPVDENGVSLFWRSAPEVQPEPDPAPKPVKATPRPASRATAPPNDVDLDRARELIANGAGRVVLQNELGVTEHTAKRLVKSLSSNGSQVTVS